MLGILSSVALGADVTGKWFGVFHVVTPDGGKRDDKAVLILKRKVMKPIADVRCDAQEYPERKSPALQKAHGLARIGVLAPRRP